MAGNVESGESSALGKLNRQIQMLKTLLSSLNARHEAVRAEINRVHALREFYQSLSVELSSQSAFAGDGDLGQPRAVLRASRGIQQLTKQVVSDAHGEVEKLNGLLRSDTNQGYVAALAKIAKELTAGLEIAIRENERPELLAAVIDDVRGVIADLEDASAAERDLERNCVRAYDSLVRVINVSDELRYFIA
ncbi:hypothetical protein GGR57DRAFT_508133 [Xylariaceae sp. FL1272]|nr:hypothetical protein GGR57DRAFT_508133 [Xylariaceae sp. FL1272]